MEKKKIMHKVSFLIILLLAWEATAYSGIYPKALFPSLEAILIKFYMMLINDNLFGKALYSISLVVASIAISLILSVLMIVIGNFSQYFKDSTEVMNSIASPLPGIAILPLVILWFGISRISMVFIIVHATLWPLWSQLTLSVDRINSRFSRFIHAFKISKKKSFYHVFFLGTKPDLITGLQISWSRGWRALISIEMIFGMVGNQTGLGWLIYERRMYMDTAGLIAGLFAIAICGILFESLFLKAKKTEATHGTID